MNTNKIIGIILGIIIIGAAFFSVFGRDAISRLIVDEDDDDTEINSNIVTNTQTPPPQTNNQNNTGQGNTNTQTLSGYTMSQITPHNSATSCYSTINNKVYDLTSWTNSHPGGKAAILMICGKDGSALFNTQHSRSNKVANILSDFYIGILN